MLAGIDLGGTQVRVALARSDGQLIASFKTKTPLLGTPQRVVEWAAAEIERHRGREKVRSIAIGAPGPIDVKRGVLVNPPNLHGWRNVPLAAMLRRATGAPAHLANDAVGVGNLAHDDGSGEVAVIVAAAPRWKDVDDHRRSRSNRPLAAKMRHRTFRRTGDDHVRAAEPHLA